jgi:hypothetical protein
MIESSFSIKAVRRLESARRILSVLQLYPARGASKLILLLYALALPGESVLLGQACPPVVLIPPDESAVLTVEKADGSCTVTDGGYVKTNTSYKLHISATVEGKCQPRVYQSGQCQNSFIEWRNIGTTWQYVTPQGTPVGSVIAQTPPSNTIIQSFLATRAARQPGRRPVPGNTSIRPRQTQS